MKPDPWSEGGVAAAAAHCSWRSSSATGSSRSSLCARRLDSCLWLQLRLCAHVSSPPPVPEGGEAPAPLPFLALPVLSAGPRGVDGASSPSRLPARLDLRVNSSSDPPLRACRRRVDRRRSMLPLAPHVDADRGVPCKGLQPSTRGASAGNERVAVAADGSIRCIDREARTRPHGL
jgi:hypothetical protein